MNVLPFLGIAAAVMLYVAPTLAADPPPAFAACKSCHKTEAGAKMIGPSLFGVYDRKAATVEGFAYSEGMKKADWTWDDEHLSKWLENPKAMIPGTKMAFPGIKKPEDIQSVIGFLKTLK